MATTRCRACDGATTSVVDLGAQPAGGYPVPGAPVDRKIPLRLGVCLSCGLAQLVDPSPPEADDPDAPSPLSSATMTAHARAFVDDLVVGGLATPQARILSLASHGGHLAPFLAERGLTTTIVEANPYRAARLTDGRTRVIVDDIDGTLRSPGLTPGGFDLLLDSYLLAHVEHPRAALERMAILLAPGGTAVLEFDHVLAKVSGGQWDAIRHGHRSYLALGWLVHELAGLGLAVTDAIPQPVYGGALRVVARAGARPGASVLDVLAREEAAMIDQVAGLVPLAEAIGRARRDVLRYLRRARDAGRRVVGYGAPARAVTFLNALGIGPELLAYVVDRAVAKQGRMIPGVRIPILGLDALSGEAPDEILILTWDLAPEVVASLEEMPALKATRYLIAMPQLQEATAGGAAT